ncbi:MAG: hypothetical protein OXR73_23915, partial [Myxococcales bacterium]|nr:hypothetical protein [Myxococcales bacterium]
MSQAPRIIAAIVRATLQDLNAADEKLGQRVRRALDPEALRAIERSSGLSWLPVEIDVMLTETLFELAGAFAAKRTLRSMMTTSVGSPLMRNVVQTAMRLHGSDVARLLTWTPKVWALVYRNCGTVTIESDGLGSVIRLRELPEVLCKSPVYLTG